MEFLVAITDYLLEDPLRILYITGGSGGVWFWWDKWASRPRVRVRVLDEHEFICPDTLDQRALLKIEVENVGTAATSLHPEVLMSAYTPKGRPIRFIGEVKAESRELQPFRQCVIEIEFDNGTQYTSSLFRRFVFQLTRGRSKIFRVRSASGEQLNILSHLFWLSIFRAFGYYNESQA